MNIIFRAGEWIFGRDGFEHRFPLSFWNFWPKGSNDNGLMFLKNTFFYTFMNVSWHSLRHFPQYHSLRYSMLQAVCEGKIDAIQSCLKDGWDINKPIDYSGQFNAASLSAHLDNLEVLHYLDLNGANLNQGVGDLQFTPLMRAIGKWNVRIVDYLIQRQVDPFKQDKYGFTALQKAKIRKLKTLTSILQEYEEKYPTFQKVGQTSAILTDEWKEIINRDKIKLNEYVRVDVWKQDNESIMEFKPSQLLRKGEYPLSNFQTNQIIYSLFGGNYHFFTSNDYKHII